MSFTQRVGGQLCQQRNGLLVVINQDTAELIRSRELACIGQFFHCVPELVATHFELICVEEVKLEFRPLIELIFNLIIQFKNLLLRTNLLLNEW